MLGKKQHQLQTALCERKAQGRARGPGHLLPDGLSPRPWERAQGSGWLATWLALDCHSLCRNRFQANAIGRGAKSVREFLEKNYTDEAIETDDLTIKLVIKALLEVSSSLKSW